MSHFVTLQFLYTYRGWMELHRIPYQFKQSGLTCYKPGLLSPYEKRSCPWVGSRARRSLRYSIQKGNRGVAPYTLND